MKRAEVWPPPEPAVKARRVDSDPEPDPDDYNILDSVAPAEMSSDGWHPVMSAEDLR